MKRRCDIITTMSGKRSSQSTPTKSKEGVTITTEQEQTTKWVEHFRDILNKSRTTEMTKTTSNEGPLRNDNGNPPSKAEIERALKQLKNGKAAGPDGIPPDALKVDPKTTAAMLHPLFLLQIWEMENVPSEWKNGYLVKLPKKRDLGRCKNWRGIMLLAILCKVFCRFIIERLKHALDHNLRCERTGFRQDKSCADHITCIKMHDHRTTYRMADSAIHELYRFPLKSFRQC